jgi:hypothetical protein
MKHAEGVDPDEFSSDDSDDSLLLEEDIMLIEKALYEDEDDEIEQQNIAADPQRWECVSILYGHKAAVTAVAFSNVGGELLPSVYPAPYALPLDPFPTTLLASLGLCLCREGLPPCLRLLSRVGAFDL